MKRWLAAAWLLAADAAGAECAADVASLRRLADAPGFALRWTEVGMDDGKPLRLVLRDTDRGLHLRFDKAGEGLWAEGEGSVCVVGGTLEVRFQGGGLRAGEAAHWLLRRALQAGGRFTLAREPSGELRVGTTGWRGRFVADAAR